MKRLKLTNSYASKVMLARREAIVNNSQQPSVQASNKPDGGPGEIGAKVMPNTPHSLMKALNFLLRHRLGIYSKKCTFGAS